MWFYHINLINKFDSRENPNMIVSSFYSLSLHILWSKPKKMPLKRNPKAFSKKAI
jgi:hypothetical protein